MKYNRILFFIISFLSNNYFVEESSIKRIYYKSNPNNSYILGKNIILEIDSGYKLFASSAFSLAAD